jgi:hypothetical protein
LCESIRASKVAPGAAKERTSIQTRFGVDASRKVG